MAGQGLGHPTSPSGAPALLPFLPVAPGGLKQVRLSSLSAEQRHEAAPWSTALCTQERFTSWWVKILSGQCSGLRTEVITNLTSAKSPQRMAGSEHARWHGRLLDSHELWGQIGVSSRRCPAPSPGAGQGRGPAGQVLLTQGGFHF